MIDIFQNCKNKLGFISSEIKDEIRNYLKNPTHENWTKISFLIIGSDARTTLHQTVSVVNPMVQKNSLNQWESIPKVEEVYRAILIAGNLD